MIERKCDLCGRVVGKSRDGLSPEEFIGDSFGISVTIAKDGQEGYYNGNYYMLVCDRCLEATLFENSDTADSKELLLLALHNFNLFSNDEIKKRGYGIPAVDTGKHTLTANIANLVEHMSPDAINLALQVKERMSRLSAETKKKILARMDEQMLEELDKAEAGESDK